ncbi:Gfo/Idh/MocA family protein [Prosthecobacter sp.]|jgi:predicted dehydrogenase|uniref:Gfo/Idh/MocA family protein n=1 Tax=Prosthecobacter sp. TaxID=1965333 RepID=UPI0037831863
MSASTATPSPEPDVPLRAVVIGCGWIGAGTALDPATVGVQSHAEAYARHPRITLAGLADYDLTRAKTAATAFGPCEVFDDPAVMLEKLRPEIVSICTPDESHAAMLRLALAKSSTRAVLMEKPLAVTVAEAHALVQTASQQGVVLSVNYSRRFCPAFRHLRDELQQGVFGRVQQVHGYYGKGIIHNGTHWIDLLRYLISDIERVIVPTALKPDEHTPSAQIICAGGIPATLSALDHTAFTLFEMDIIGTAGRVRILDGGHRILRACTVESPLYAGYVNLGDEQIEERCLKDAIVHAVNDLLACLDGRAPQPACTGADAVACLETATAILAVA